MPPVASDSSHFTPGEVVLRDQEDLFNTYVAYYRLRHGCDPDTSEVPIDYLDQLTGGSDEEPTEP